MERPMASISCPRCGTRFEVSREPGPARFECPSCGLEGILSGFKLILCCPRCKTAFEAARGTGPARITCEKCGKEAMLYSRR